MLLYAEVSRVDIDTHSVVHLACETLVFATSLLGESALQFPSASEVKALAPVLITLVTAGASATVPVRRSIAHVYPGRRYLFLAFSLLLREQ